MSRFPVLPLAGALISALMIVMTSLVGVAPAGAVPVTTTRSAGSIELETDLTLLIGRCEGCLITLLSYDGTDPAYYSTPATVTGGFVTITLPSARTAGMSVRVEPPWVTPSTVDTNVAWRYNGKAIGDTIGFKEARTRRRASGCWAGTVNEAVTLRIKVRRVGYAGRPGAIAWAPETQSYVPPMATARNGILVSDGVRACNLYR